MNSPHDDPSNVPSDGYSDSENDNAFAEDTQSLEQQFKKREPRLLDEDLDASDVYQRVEDSQEQGIADTLKALGELEESDESGLGFEAESASFSPTPPKVNVTRLDPALVYPVAAAAVGVGTLDEDEERGDEGDFSVESETEDLPGEDHFGAGDSEDGASSEDSDSAGDSPDEGESGDDWISRMSEKVKEAVEEDTGITEEPAAVELPKVGFLAPGSVPEESGDDETPFGEPEIVEKVSEAVTEISDDVSEFGSSSDQTETEEVEVVEDADEIEEFVDEVLPDVGFRAPNVTPVMLNRDEIYGRETEAEPMSDLEQEGVDLPGDEEDVDEFESEEEVEVPAAESEPDLPVVGFRAPNVTPVMLKPEAVYVADESGTEDVDDEAVVGNNDNDQEKKIAALKSPQVEEMEVMESEKKESTSLAQSGASEKPISKWAFWRRPSKRDQQLARISEGYLEMVDLVRAIRSQLETQNENNLILRDSLAHLPEAMKGLDSFSKSQHTVGEALKEIHGEMQSYSAKDQKLAESMTDFNDTLKGIDGTSKATMQTFDRVQERMRDSDIRMENLFQNVQNTEEKVSDTMVRLQRNMAVMQYIFLFCLMIVIGVLVFALAGGKQDKNDPAPVQKIIVETPAAPAATGGQPESNGN